MDAGNLIFWLLIIGGVLGMFFMHRGHGHGGMGGCGGHGHSDNDAPPDARRGDEKKPALGPPGTQSSAPAPTSAEGRRHRHGC